MIAKLPKGCLYHNLPVEQAISGIEVKDKYGKC